MTRAPIPVVDAGRSVIVIEHHQAVMAHADWIIDLGPGAGRDGGRVVFEGLPADLVAARRTLTGEHLAKYVGAAPPTVTRSSRPPAGSSVGSRTSASATSPSDSRSPRCRVASDSG